MVVMAIIGILITIVIVAIDPVKLINGARDSRMRSDLNQIKAAMQLYYNDCKAYPTVTEFADFSEAAGTAWTGNGDAKGDCSPTTTKYMRRVPVQTSGTDYLYNAVDSAGGACSNAGGDDCVAYVAGADLADPKADDTATTNQCSSPALAGEFEVCND